MMDKKLNAAVFRRMTLFLFIAVVNILIVVPCGIQPGFCLGPPKTPAPNAERLFEAAEKAARSNEQEAIRLYKERLVIKPDAWDARTALGGLYEKSGRLPEAIGEYQRYWGGTKTKEACILLAKSLSRADFRFDAASVAEEGAKRYPADLDLQLLTGEMFLKINAGKRAIPYLQTVLKAKPDNAANMSFLGKAYELDNNLSDAFKHYSLALKINLKEDMAVQGLKRLRGNAVKTGMLLFFPPDGWLHSGHNILNTTTGQTILIDVKKGKTSKKTAEELAAGVTPMSMFNKTSDIPDATLKALAEQAAKETKRNVAVGEIREKLGAIGMPRYTMKSETIEGPYKSIMVHAYTKGANINEQFSRYVVSLSDEENTISFLSDTGEPDPKTKAFLKNLTGRLIPAEGGK